MRKDHFLTILMQAQVTFLQTTKYIINEQREIEKFNKNDLV